MVAPNRDTIRKTLEGTFSPTLPAQFLFLLDSLCIREAASDDFSTQAICSSPVAIFRRSATPGRSHQLAAESRLLPSAAAVVRT